MAGVETASRRTAQNTPRRGARAGPDDLGPERADVEGTLRIDADGWGGGGSQDSPTTEAREWRASQPQCMPCSNGVRIASGGMCILVLGLVAVSYIAVTVWAPPPPSSASRVALVFFHLFIALMIASYVQTIRIDAGAIPPWWSRAVSRRPDLVPHVWCNRTQRAKPPRAHFDRVTERHVLNMDHYCPWVANTVGFYNRKFFILFVVYASAACLCAVCIMYFLSGVHPLRFLRAPRAPHSRIEGQSYHPFRSYVGIVFALDLVLGLTVGLLAIVHVRMAATNETTIETARDPWKYDVGTRGNWEQVFGRNPLLWALPVWGEGPFGDGLSWPTRHDGETTPKADIGGTFV